MSPETTASAGDDPHRLGDLIDVLCDRFEAELNKGNVPRIEESLASISDSGRNRLLRELVGLEIEIALSRSEPIDVLGYYVRFPNDAGVLDQVRAEYDLQSPHEAITRSPSQEGDLETAVIKRDEPTSIKHFLLRSKVGQGGFGTVWRAFDTKLKREVAVKIPRQDKLVKVDIAVLLQEAQAAAVLHHPNIVSVHEVGEGDQATLPYIVTDLVDGPNLKDWLKTNQYSPREIAELTCKIAQALEHAHSRGIIHRDLKPANVLLDGAGQPHLADFGLAKRLAGNDLPISEGQLAGTPQYMSPEQARGEYAALDHRTDIYSLGVMLYELLTGRTPFDGELSVLIEEIISKPPAPLRKMKPSVPDDLESVCLRCLAKNPASRYGSARELADDLQRFLDGESLRGIAVPGRKRVLKWISRHRRFASSICGTILICCGASIGLWKWYSPVTPRRLVEFTTEPAGCEITVVKLDEATGDPDPDQIEHAIGKTPLKMRLKPGDYLVVAVEDDRHFHEVLRHVPDVAEKIAMKDYRYWKLDTDGCIRFNKPISVPHGDLVANMPLLKGNDLWHWPKDPSASTPQADIFQMPDFYVETQETTANWQQPSPQNGLTDRRFYAAVQYAELTGKRLPTNLELLYLADTVGRANEKQASQLDTLPDGTSINGITQLPWEWTSTLAYSEPQEQKVLGGPSGFQKRIVRCGSKPISRPNHGTIVFPSAFVFEYDNNSNTCVRCVRSTKPRRHPEDFVRPVMALTK